MKLTSASTPSRLCLLSLCLVVVPLATAQATHPAAHAPAPQDQVLFNSDKPPAPPKIPSTKSIDTPTDAERNSLTFTGYDLDVHLTPAKSQISVRAKLNILNTGTEPLTRLALQLSSTLNWESFGMKSGDRIVPLRFAQHTVDTDTDHTGQAKEALVTLPEPLAPGAGIELTAFYSGKIQKSGRRLERIGAPADRALAADWDQIAPGGTSLRGFGNVLWYPTASAPVFLGDGAKLFQLVGRTRLRQSTATIHLRLTVEYSGHAPDAAYFCGERKPLTVVSGSAGAEATELSGVATVEFPAHPLGFRTPSLFITGGAPDDTAGGLISAVTDRPDTLPSYSAAAVLAEPLLKEWLGEEPLTPL
ncbi:MAG TPA: hypothetical protein VFE22_08615, partial [Edaphobacter sp.]|nr:hypothetical protein [Edaphobacter sp.]